MEKETGKDKDYTGTIVTIIIITILAFFVIALIIANNREYYMGNDESSYWESRRRFEQLEEYKQMLYIEGDFYNDGNNVILYSNLKQDRGRVIEDITLYNVLYKPKHKITIEELNKEFDDFCQNDKEPETLIYLNNTLETIDQDCAAAGVSINGYGYHRIVKQKLEEYGTTIYDATDEEWYRAAEYAATKVGVYILCREIDRAYGDIFTISY